MADLLLIPFLPRSFDVWTLEKMAALIEDMRLANPQLIAYAFLNRADPCGARVPGSVAGGTARKSDAYRASFGHAWQFDRAR